MLKLIVFIFSVLFCVLGAAEAKVTEIATLVTPESQGTVYSLYGDIPLGSYYPLRVRLENNADEGEEWTLVAKLSVGRIKGLELNYSKTMQVAANSSVIYDLMIPSFHAEKTEMEMGSNYHYGSYFNVELEGSLISPRRERAFHRSSSFEYQFEMNGRSDWNPVRILGYDPGVSNFLPNGLFDGAFYGTLPRGIPMLQPIELTAETMSDDWRAYWGFGMICLSSKEWGRLSQLQKQAVMKWVQSGGTLFLPDWEWLAGFSVPALGQENFKKGHCFYGLGEIQLDKKRDEFLDVIQNVMNEGAFPFTNLELVTLDEYEGEWERRIGGYYVVLLVFIILIGPVNVMWLCRGTRRYRVFLMTPFIVVACIASLFLYTVLKDGVGGNGDRVRFSHYDGGLNQVFRLQSQASETGLVLTRSFEIPQKARFEMISVSGLSRKTFELREERYDGDWFRSRARNSQLVAWSDASREGISLESTTEAGYVVVNSRIKGTLKPFVFRDQKNDYWFADSLSLGEKKRLERIDDTAALSYMKRVCEGSGSELLLNLARRQMRGENVFFGGVVNDSSQFIESLDSVDWEDGTHVATGSVKNEEGTSL